mmetsp:Transcript_26053/g.71455  ORF Transcript_26053/g.71455 Transcript_26053/m.71455 type:complete len:267 (+) Transcript_26053:484-1284(+)
MEGRPPKRRPAAEAKQQVQDCPDRTGFDQRPEPRNPRRRDVLSGPRQTRAAGRSQCRAGAPLRRSGRPSGGSGGNHDGGGGKQARRGTRGIPVRVLSGGRLLPPAPGRHSGIGQCAPRVLAAPVPERGLVRPRQRRRPAADPHGFRGRLFAGRGGTALSGRGRSRGDPGVVRVGQVPPRGSGHVPGAIRGGGMVQSARIAGRPGGHQRLAGFRRPGRSPPAGRIGRGCRPGDGGVDQHSGLVVSFWWFGLVRFGSFVRSIDRSTGR